MGETLKARQEKFIAALLLHQTVGDAAKACGIGETTAFRWLNEPEMRAKYQQARRLGTEQAIAQLQQSTSEAVEALKRNLRCGNFFVEVNAAKIIIDTSLRAIEIGELEQRILELETLAEARGGKRRYG